LKVTAQSVPKPTISLFSILNKVGSPASPKKPSIKEPKKASVIAFNSSVERFKLSCASFTFFKPSSAFFALSANWSKGFSPFTLSAGFKAKFSNFSRFRVVST